MAIKLHWLKRDDPDLTKIAAALNAPGWEFDGKPPFTAESLREFLSDDRRFYLLGYLDDKVAGAFHGYYYLHPTGENYVWLDEVDVNEAYRRRGLAKAMMQEVFRYAEDRGAKEVWLGTEADNVAALALYRSLKPTETENGPTFSWKLS